MDHIKSFDHAVTLLHCAVINRKWFCSRCFSTG